MMTRMHCRLVEVLAGALDEGEREAVLGDLQSLAKVAAGQCWKSSVQWPMRDKNVTLFERISHGGSDLRVSSENAPGSLQPAQ